MKNLIVVLCLAILAMTGCSRGGEPALPKTSPSGVYAVAAEVNASEGTPGYRSIVLHLQDDAGNRLSSMQTSASDVQKWSVGWMEDEDVLVLQSSDIGTRAYLVDGGALVETSVTPGIMKRAEELKKDRYGP